MTVIVLTSSTIGRSLKLTNRKLPPTRPQRRDTNRRGETAMYPSVLELVHVTNIPGKAIYRRHVYRFRIKKKKEREKKTFKGTLGFVSEHSQIANAT